MLTRDCGRIPCIAPPSWGHSHPSCRAPVCYVNGSNLFQPMVADLRTGNHHLSLLGRLAVPGLVNIRRVRGNMPLASHHCCEGPLEAHF